MAVFKCKMCGGALDIAEGATVAECAFCGTKQTVPRLTDEKRANLYDRANHFRRIGDYDKAMSLYEQILSEDSTDAEAYWSIVLCRFGIEYVEDPATHRRVPTVHRTQFTSILADEDYLSALSHADGYQKDVLEAEAKEIDRLQKEILAISKKEKPFDVFICYKETGDDGARTKDSVLAQDLYFALTNEGMKVFFARITLEDKLGSAYEPYIFAALHSAKVMVVLGTKPEYFKAVWVKNEWSRYLSLMKAGEHKTLIPAYRDMDPYDLPDDFSHLQALDMSRIGFLQDLVRGIRKILDEGQRTAPQTTSASTSPAVPSAAPSAVPASIAPLLTRARLFLEDEDWDSANEYCERVLDINPECADAYFLKLLASRHCKNEAALVETAAPVSDDPNYRKALRFSSGDAHKTIEGLETAIQDARVQQANERQYLSACAAMDAKSYEDAIEIFGNILSYRDSAQKIEECRTRAQEAKKLAVYNAALHRVAERGASGRALETSIAELETIRGFRDSDVQIEHLRQRLDEWNRKRQEEEERYRREAEQRRLEAERRKAEQARLAAIRRKRIKIASIIVAIALTAILIFTIVFVSVDNHARAGLKMELVGDGYSVTDGNNASGDLVIPTTYHGKPVTSISAGAFQNCTELTSVTIPESVMSIAEGAFSGCTALTAITLPDNVTSIADNTFCGCSNLTSVTLANRTTDIGKYAFSGCSALTSITLPDGVISIADSTFRGCSKLTSIVLGNSVKSIGAYAFSGCTNLTSMTIPDSVTSIGKGSFSGCTNLSSVTFANTSQWYYTSDSTATKGTAISVTDAATNAKNLRDTYATYFWYRKDS